MSSPTVLDTRTPYRSRGTQTPAMTTTASTSQTGSPGLTFFQRAVHELVRSSHRDRAARRRNVIDRLRGSRDPMGYINELIEQCVVKGGSEGLDIGIDVLSQFGELTLQYAREFWKKDWERWGDRKGAVRHHFNDDAWYILLRAAARSELEPWQKMQMLLYCSMDGTESIREAGIHALGDMGGPVAARLLRRIEKGERSPSVLQAVTEVLADLEG
jgi:hypothetical protein